MPITDDTLARVAKALSGFKSGSLSVDSATARRDEDSEGHPRIRIVATVSAPSGTDGWNLDEVLELQRRAERLLGEQDPEAPWVLVELRSVDEQISDADAEDDVEGAFRQADE